VLAWLIERATDPALLEQELSALVDSQASDAVEELSALQAAEARILRSLEQWTADYEALLIDRSEYYGHRGKLEEQLELIQGQMQNRQTAVARLDPEAMHKTIADLIGDSTERFRRAWYARENLQEVKALLRQIGLRVTITTGAATPALDA
jgi:chromosome segregation ATPase